MIRAPKQTKSKHVIVDKSSLQKRVRQWIRAFNAGRFSDCYALLDPKLVAGSRVLPETYTDQLAHFREVYSSIRPWNVKVNLHHSGAIKQGDPRPFAFVYIVWQDARHGFHLFRERWVFEEGAWYTRVAGLVPTRVAG